jgi:mycofactocin precursor peptide peptidase
VGLTSLSARTWTELSTDRPPLVCVPLGSCEQHGPHLPLDTDTVVAEALAAGLAQRRGDVLVGPSLTVTASGEHAGFTGTLSIGTAVLTDVLVELARSADWAAGLVLVNGHGGNRDAVAAAVRTITAEGRAVLPWWPAVAGGDAHAGITETSLMLALEPTAVRVDRAVAGPVAPLDELAPALRSGGVRAVSANGVLGDPTGASAQHGRVLLAALVDDLVATVAAWRAADGGRRAARPRSTHPPPAAGRTA